MTDKPANKCPRWIRILLFVSLACNLAVIGIVAGHQLRDGRDNYSHRMSPPNDFRLLASSMPDAHSKILKEAFRASRAEYSERRKALGQMRQNMIRILREDPFDPEAFTAVMTEQKGFWTELSTRSEGLLMERINAMSPAELAELADNIENWRKRSQDRRPPPKRD